MLNQTNCHYYVCKCCALMTVCEKIEVDKKKTNPKTHIFCLSRNQIAVDLAKQNMFNCKSVRNVNDKTFQRKTLFPMGLKIFGCLKGHFGLLLYNQFFVPGFLWMVISFYHQKYILNIKTELTQRYFYNSQNIIHTICHV